jgi:flagellar L-ring protein precursor FlgH
MNQIAQRVGNLALGLCLSGAMNQATAQSPAMGASPGSLFAPSGGLADAVRDLKANLVGYIVTIIVNESASAVASGVTNSSRKSNATSNVAALAGTLPTSNPLTNLLDVTGTQQIQGSGQTTRNLTLSTTIAARVIDTTSNGMLVVEATKNVGVNSERQTVTLRGIVRPSDLTTANTVLSTLVADLQLQVNGKGVVGDAIRRPNLLYRLLMGILPF